jgi:hypothetical protein
LSDDEVHALLAAEEDAMSATMKESVSYGASLAGAREYLSLLESGARYRAEPLNLTMPSAPARSGASLPPAEARVDATFDAARSRGPRAAASVHARQEPPRQEAGEQGSLWHRIPLGDEAELVISERVYARHRDRVDWLVRWARKVFG